MREKYESLSAAVLRELAKARGMKGISTLKKAELVEAMLAEDEKEAKVQEAKKEADSIRAEIACAERRRCKRFYFRRCSLPDYARSFRQR